MTLRFRSVAIVLREALLAALLAALLCLNFSTPLAVAAGESDVVAAVIDCGDAGDDRHPPCHACEPADIVLPTPPVEAVLCPLALGANYRLLSEPAGTTPSSPAYRSRAPPIAA